MREKSWDKGLGNFREPKIPERRLQKKKILGSVLEEIDGEKGEKRGCEFGQGGGVAQFSTATAGLVGVGSDTSVLLQHQLVTELIEGEGLTMQRLEDPQALPST